MKLLLFTLLLLSAVTSCDQERTSQSKGDIASEQSAGAKPLATSDQSVIAPLEDTAADERRRILKKHALQFPLQPESELLIEANRLTLNRNATGQLTPEALAKLELMAPSLFEAGLLIDVLGAVPLEQLPRFTNLVFESVRRLAPQSGRAFNPKYEDAIRLAEHLDPRKLAPLVFEHLAIAPPYEFPEFHLPGGWGDATLSVHASKGTQGLIATTVVRYGDDALMARYRDELITAPPKLQRVMIWALSRSPEIADFDLLWKLLKQERDPDRSDTIIRALNSIPRTMESLAKNPTAKEMNRGSLSSSELKAVADTCRNRLKNANLIVPLTIWD